MKSLADHISATGRTPPSLAGAVHGFATTPSLAKEHPDWLLKDENGIPISAGITWSGHHSAWISRIRKYWTGLNSLFARSAAGGTAISTGLSLHRGIDREKIQGTPAGSCVPGGDAGHAGKPAGDAYILACVGADRSFAGSMRRHPHRPGCLPVLGKHAADRLRAYNNPNDTSTQNAIRDQPSPAWLSPLRERRTRWMSCSSARNTTIYSPARISFSRTWASSRASKPRPIYLSGDGLQPIRAS